MRVSIFLAIFHKVASRLCWVLEHPYRGPSRIDSVIFVILIKIPISMVMVVAFGEAWLIVLILLVHFKFRFLVMLFRVVSMMEWSCTLNQTPRLLLSIQ